MSQDLKDIARQMMENNPGKDTDIILGGGLAPFVNYDLIDEEQKTRYLKHNFKRELPDS